MSCPWISHCAGGGVVTYRLPLSTVLADVLADFCNITGQFSGETRQGYEGRLSSYGGCSVL